MRLQGPRSPQPGAGGIARAPFGKREKVRSTGARLVALCATAIVTVSLAAGFTPAAAAAVPGPCDPGGNPVACENSKPGTPASEWDIVRPPAAGSRVSRRRQRPARANRSRSRSRPRAATRSTSTASGTTAATAHAARPPRGRVEPGEPAGLRHGPQHVQLRLRHVVGLDAVAGPCGCRVRRVHREADDGHGRERDPVRRPETRGESDVVMKTSDATWQAYNDYGGADFYTAPSSLTGTQARAFKISYNRPYNTRDSGRAATSCTATNTRHCASSSATASTCPTRPTST